MCAVSLQTLAMEIAVHRYGCGSRGMMINIHSGVTWKAGESPPTAAFNYSAASLHMHEWTSELLMADLCMCYRVLTVGKVTRPGGMNSAQRGSLSSQLAPPSLNFWRPAEGISCFCLFIYLFLNKHLLSAMSWFQCSFFIACTDDLDLIVMFLLIFPNIATSQTHSWVKDQQLDSKSSPCQLFFSFQWIHLMCFLHVSINRLYSTEV